MYQYTNGRGRAYFLNQTVWTTKHGREMTTFFFSKEADDRTIAAIPAGHEIVEAKNGLPILRKIQASAA